MKKIYRLLPLCLIGVLFFLSVPRVQAQRETIAGWVFPSTTAATAIASDCGTGALYADGTNGSSVWNTTTGATTPGIYFQNTGTAPQEALCEVTTAGKDITFIGNAYNDSSVVFVVSTESFVDIQVTFNTRGSSTGFTTQVWSHSTDGVNFTTDTTLTGMNSGTSTSYRTPKTLSLSSDANNQSVLYIKLTFSGASGTGNNRFDNIMITGISDLPITGAPAFSVAAGNYCNPFEVEISSYTPDAVIYYTTDGSDPDSLSGILYTNPVAINSTTTLNAIAYAEGLAESAIQSATYVLPTTVSTIAEFKANNTDTYFRMTGDVTVVHKAGSYLFVQDATGATCIYSNATDAYTSGTVLSGGFCAEKGAYYGMTEFTNPDMSSITATAGTAVAPIEVSLAELNANFAEYESRLVTITNGSFVGSTTLVSSTNAIAPFMQGTDTILVSNQLRTLDNYTTPNTMCNVTGFAIPHDESHRLCPRGSYDIAEIIPTIVINQPADEQIFEEGDNITPDFDIQFFLFENDNMVRTEVQWNGAPLFETYLHNDEELAAFEALDLTSSLNGVGDYQLIAQLLTADSTMLAADTVSFSLVAAYIAIETSENTLYFTEAGESQTFTATAFRLTQDITVSVDNNDFTITPSTLPSNAEAETITVTFNGTESTTAMVTLTSDTVVATVALVVDIPIDTLIYSTGFETSEGFFASTNYQNDSPNYFGPEGQQWGTIQGTVSTNSPIYGAQSMQMRYYGTAGNNHIGHMGSAYTNFDLHNVTKVEFTAQNNGSLQLRASFSHDGGATYEGDSLFTVTTNAQRYTYHVTDSGEYYSVRIKFEYVLPETEPTNTTRLYIDSVCVFGVTGLEPSIVETPVISMPSNAYITPITVDITCETEDALIYYTTNGNTPTEEDSLYSAPLTIDASCTLKARAFKGGMDPSNVAFATYTFPVEVATIADFKEAGANDNTVTYKITGDVTFVYRNNRRVFVEDATGGLLVYDNSNPVITGTYTEGDVISGGIIGTYTSYAGMNEMIPSADWAAASGQVTVTPVIATIADITENFELYEARLVRINSVAFVEGGAFTTSSQSELEISDASEETMLLRNQFMTVDTTVMAGDSADVIGLAAIYTTNDNTNYQLFPRTNADIIPIISDTTGLNEAEVLKVVAYPNPTQDVVTLSGMTSGSRIEVLNSLGQMVYRSENVGESASISLASQPTGLYLIRVVNADNRVAIVKIQKL